MIGTIRMLREAKVITADDVQNALRDRLEYRVELSPLGASLVATLLNAWTYEGSGLSRDNRQSIAREFVARDLPETLFRLLSESPLEGKVIGAADVIHWMNPRWPDFLKSSPVMGFIFSKE